MRCSAARSAARRGRNCARRLERAGFTDRAADLHELQPAAVHDSRCGSRSGSSGLSTPEETGADISVPPAPINRALTGLVAAESMALRYVNMPLGSSLLAWSGRNDLGSRFALGGKLEFPSAVWKLKFPSRETTPEASAATPRACGTRRRDARRRACARRPPRRTSLRTADRRRSGHSQTRWCRAAPARSRPRPCRGTVKGPSWPRAPRALLSDHRHGADIPRPPRPRVRRQFAVQVLELVRVGGAGVSRASDAWASAERVDLEPRILADGRESRRCRVVLRLQPRVLGKGLAGFLGFWDGRHVGQGQKRDRQVREQVSDFTDLAGVGRGDEQGTGLTVETPRTVLTVLRRRSRGVSVEAVPI